MIKGVRVRIRVRITVKAGARECTMYFFLVLQTVVNVFVFVGLVASYDIFNKVT